MNTLFDLEKEEWSPKVLEIISTWNNQRNLKSFKAKKHTKIFKYTHDTIERIMTVGFKMPLDVKWKQKNDILPKHLKSVPYDSIIKTIETTNTLANTPKYAYIRTMTMDKYFYNIYKSTFLVIKINELEEDLPERIFKYFCNYFEKINIERTNSNKEWKQNFEILTRKEIEQKAQKYLADLEDAMCRAINIVKGDQENYDWADEYERDEAFQIMYDILKKVTWEIPVIGGHTVKTISKHYLIQDYIEYIKTKTMKDFSIHYLKVHGKGVWRNFVHYKWNNYGEYIGL